MKMEIKKRRRVLRSRITGELQLYALSDETATCDRFEADMAVLKTEIQRQFDEQNVDAQVERCRQIRGTFWDYLIVETWVPETSPLDPATWTTILFIIKWVTLTVAAGIAIVSICWAVRNYILGPHPKFVCDICGQEFDSLPGLTAHRRTAHPEHAAYQCPHCGAAFAKREELDTHMKDCLFRPTEVPTWIPWAVAGLAIVAAIVIVPPLIRALPRKETIG